MKKICLLILGVFSLCGFKLFQTQQDRFNEAIQQYRSSHIGKQFYVCGQDHNLFPGRKTLQAVNCVTVPPHASPHVKCIFDFYNTSGQIERYETILTYDYLNTYDFAQSFADMDNRFNNYPFCSVHAYKQYLINAKEEKIRQQQEKIKQQQAEQHRLNQEQDCTQAKEKANARKQEIFKELGTEKIAKFINFKVVDFPNNGIIIANDCRNSYYDCEEQRYLIYTADTDYATNEIFNDKGLLYKRVGNYKYQTVMGSINSIPAYEATEYSIKEINYKTYLKDQSISACY